MKDMPLKKIRNFGGKLGAELQALGCSTAGEVLALPPATLHQHFGERTPWILYTVQGNSDEPVQVSTRSCHISMLLRIPKTPPQCKKAFLLFSDVSGFRFPV